MASINIQPYLDDIQAAMYGRDVRGSIYESIRVLNNVVSESMVFGFGSPENAINPSYLYMVYIDLANSGIYQVINKDTGVLGWELVGTFEGRVIVDDFKDVSTEDDGLIKKYEIGFNKGTPSKSVVEVKDGNSIKEITGPETEGSEDTYTIKLYEGDSVPFIVHNVDYISEITGPETEGLTDTYTIVFTDGTTKEIEVANGDTITEITGPETEGLIDVYTIHFKDAPSQTFIVTNGDPGTAWYRGDVIQGKDTNPTIFQDSGIEFANEGDIYLNFKEGSIYYCVTSGTPDKATWSFDFLLNNVSGYASPDELSDLDDVIIDFEKLENGQILELLSDKWKNGSISDIQKVDLKFDSESKNAQSGIAVNEAISNVQSKKLLNKTRITAFNKSNITGIASFDAENVWTLNQSVYYSDGSNQYVLNGATSTWEPMTWSGLTEFDGRYIWRKGSETCYSYGSNHYKLVNAYTWEPISFSGLTNFYGIHVWTDGNDIYYSYGSNQYKLVAGITWVSMTWSGLTDFDGRYIWTDGVNIYYSYGSDQYKLNGTTWVSMTWSGLTNFNGEYIWTDGNNIYYSSSYHPFLTTIVEKHYRLKGNTWVPMTWTGLTNFSGDEIWLQPFTNNVFCSKKEKQYKLNGTKWRSFSWKGIDFFDGDHVWTDGTNIYYSNNESHYKLNGTNWVPMIWNGLTYFDGADIWTDGNNIYYSSGYSSIQYKLNGTTWEHIFWDEESSSETRIQGKYVWSDGNNIYYDAGSAGNVRLYGSSWVWVYIDGLDSDRYGNKFWTDGTNIYYSDGSYQRKFNGTTWVSMTWSGLTNFNGEYIWTDGNNIYYSYGSDQYKLNGTTWEPMSWGNLTNLDGPYIWTDGTNTYYSNEEAQYKLKEISVNSKGI